MTEQEIYKAAIDKWGQALQLVMVLEETAELQKEVCKIIRGDWSSSRMDSLASEIADVQLVIGQLTYMTGTDSKVELEKQIKIKRVEKLLSHP